MVIFFPQAFNSNELKELLKYKIFYHAKKRFGRNCAITKKNKKSFYSQKKKNGENYRKMVAVFFFIIFILPKGNRNFNIYEREKKNAYLFPKLLF